MSAAGWDGKGWWFMDVSRCWEFGSRGVGILCLVVLFSDWWIHLMSTRLHETRYMRIAHPDPSESEDSPLAVI